MFGKVGTYHPPFPPDPPYEQDIHDPHLMVRDILQSEKVCWVDAPLGTFSREEGEKKGWLLYYPFDKGDLGSPRWRKLAHQTERLIRLSRSIGLLSLSFDNIVEWYYRSNLILELYGRAFDVIPTPDGPLSISVPFPVLESHLGLKTDATLLPDFTFDAAMRRAYMKRILEAPFNPGRST